MHGLRKINKTNSTAQTAVKIEREARATYLADAISKLDSHIDNLYAERGKILDKINEMGRNDPIDKPLFFKHTKATGCVRDNDPRDNVMERVGR